MGWSTKDSHRHDPKVLDAPGVLGYCGLWHDIAHGTTGGPDYGLVLGRVYSFTTNIFISLRVFRTQTRFLLSTDDSAMDGRNSKGYMWAVSAGLNAGMAAISAKLFSSWV